MPVARKPPRQKTCENHECAEKYTPRRLGQSVCSPACALVVAPKHQEKARKAIDQLERREIKVRKEKLKSRSDHLREAQVAFNEWVRLRDADRPCVSCGRHHEGLYHAGHFRPAGSNPALRFEPDNVWKQCAPCNTHLSGNLVNYRISLVQLIGPERVEWLEGPHPVQKLTVDEIKAIKAEYRAKVRELKRAAA